MATSVVSNPGAFPPAAAAEYVGVGRSTLYELIKGGEIAVIKVGRRTIIARSELDDFLRRRSGHGAA
mgnify:FL=1